MIKKIDNSVYNKCRVITEHYTKITGKDNFHLAFLTLYTSMFIIAFSQFLAMFTDDFSMFWGILIILGWSFDTVMSGLLFKKIKQDIYNAIETGHIKMSTVNSLDSFRSSRVMLLIIVAFFVPSIVVGIATEPSNLGMTASGILFFGIALRALSYYFIECFFMGGQSAWQRAKEKLKEKIAELKPSLSPAPVGATS